MRDGGPVKTNIVETAYSLGRETEWVQRVLTEKVFPREATVLRCVEWIQRIAV